MLANTSCPVCWPWTCNSYGYLYHYWYLGVVAVFCKIFQSVTHCIQYVFRGPCTVNLTSLLTFFLICLLSYSSYSLRTGPVRFQAGCQKTTKSGFSFLCSFCVVEYFVMDACLLFVLFDLVFFSTKPSWEECLHNDLFIVGYLLPSVL